MKLFKLTALFTAVMLLAGIHLHAQNGKISGGIGFFVPGVQFFAPGELNAHFPSNYPDMSFSLYTQAGSGYGIFKNFIYGFEGGGYEGGPFIKDNIQVDLTGGYSSFQLGYIVFAKGKFMAFPVIGLNWNQLDFYIHQPNQTQTFSAITMSPDEGTMLTYKATALNISMNASYFLGGKVTDGGGGGLMLGLQVGYQSPAFNGTWTYDNGAVTDGPGFDMSGFYVRLLIGGGGISYN